MSAEAVETATFLFERHEELAPVVGFLASHERRHGPAASPSYALVGIDEHDRIELPGAVHEALTKVVPIARSAANVNTTHWRRPPTSTAMTTPKRPESNYAKNAALWGRAETARPRRGDAMSGDVRRSPRHLGAIAELAAGFRLSLAIKSTLW